MKVSVNGATVTVSLDGAALFTYTFERRMIDGVSYGLNKGLIGFGSNMARGSYDNISLQVIAPEATYDGTIDFSGSTAPLGTPSSGTWAQSGGAYNAAPSATAPALVTGRIVPQSLSSTSWLQLTATLRSTGTAGIVFDHYGPNDYKFAVLDVVNGRVYLGHVAPHYGTVIDAVYGKTLSATTYYVMELNLKGASASITLNGEFMVSTSYNAALVDGAFGLVGQSGSSSYDALRIRSDDDALRFITPPTPSTPPAAPPITASVNDVAIVEGNSGSKVAVMTITLSRAVQAGETVSVTYALGGGTATAPSDYAGTSGTLTFGAGESSKTVSVLVYGDSTYEANETLNLTLSGATGMTLSKAVGVLTISNDDAQPTVSISSVSLNEGGRGATTTATLTLTLSSASPTPVTVTVSDLRTGSATSGTDYTAFTARTVTFAANATTATVTVSVLGDTTNEANETVVLGLSAASGATIGTATGTLTILNDDAKLIAAAVGPGTTSRLTTRQVRKALRSALRYWRQHGATRHQLAGIRVLQRSMSGTDLAEAVGRTIVLDTDAAGWGWSTSRLVAPRRIDLFSVLVHELGHVLGLSHTDHGVMGAVLAPGSQLAGHRQGARRAHR